MSMRAALRRRDLVAVEVAWLVCVDDRRLGKCGLLPLAQERMPEQRVEICARDAFDLDVVRLKTEGDGRVEAVGDREATTEERPAAAETPPRFVPDAHDARDVRLECLRPRSDVDALANAH